MQKPPIAPVDYIAGLAKGLAVLESFDTERQRLNASQAAQKAGITRAAARRHLLTLAHLGYLETADGFFWLSPKVLKFSGSYMASARLPRTVQPMLDKLCSQTGQSFSVVVREGTEVIIVARCTAPGKPGERLLPHGLHLGSRLPLHATSTGRVLLASLPAAELEHWLAHANLPRLTANTCANTADFQQLLAQVQQQDWCMASEEHELGVLALAVPLRNSVGHTLAALNVVTSTQHLSAQALRTQVLPLMQDAARLLRSQL